MKNRLFFIVITIVFLSALVESFHFHEDGVAHSDCSICFANQQQSDTNPAVPIHEINLHVVETEYSYSSPTVVTTPFYSPANNRAPPACLPQV